MRILVTGSSGHLGEALMRTLSATNDDAVGIDVLASPFTHGVGTITDRAFVRHWMAGVDAVLHTATLHKPHVATHTRQQFIDTNITGTLNLLEEAAAARVKAFIFTSTTSTFGDALTPPPGAPAAWITEAVTPVPKNIYGSTKTAAEDLCQLFSRNQKLPCLVLRTSRFFPEEDDDPTRRAQFNDDNLKVNEFLYRRVDIADVVEAHRLAIERAAALKFGKFIISATTPFLQEDVTALRSDATVVLQQRVPEFTAIYAARGWKLPSDIERVYVNERARTMLGWKPQYDFRRVLHSVVEGQDPRSPLAQVIGSKGYHQ